MERNETGCDDSRAQNVIEWRRGRHILFDQLLVR